MSEPRAPTDEEVAAIAAATPYDPDGKFSWSDDDIEILPPQPDDWRRTFVDDTGFETLATNLEELVRHFEQQPDFDGDLAGAVEGAMADPTFANSPYMLVADLAASTVTPPLPTSLLGRPNGGDGTARGGYGRSIFKRDGFRCSYCGFDLGGTHRGWFQLSVDHVIPAHTRPRASDPFPAAHIDDAANLVTCCRTCNDFGNRWTVNDRAPTNELAFLHPRNRVFLQRRAHLAVRHCKEEARYGRLVPPDVIGRTEDPA